MALNRPTPEHGPIILLDLNYTLVANSKSLRGIPHAHRIGHERYRGWLIDLMDAMQPAAIILLTCRNESERAATLSNIETTTGWRPDDAYFKPDALLLSPPQWKERAWTNLIRTRYSADPARYLAIESNKDTHAMYARIGIRGLKAFPASESVENPVERETRIQPALFA